MIYFIYGPDTYRSKTKLNELKEKFGREFVVEKIIGHELKLDEFRNRIINVPLLSPKRLFIIENLLASPEQKEMAGFLSEYKLSKNDILIFYETAIDKKTSLYKFLADQAEVFAFETLNPRELRKWLKDYVKNKQGEIEERAMDELMIGNDNLWLLSRELDKLLAYDKKITLKNVQLLTMPNFDDNIFSLTDAIGAGDRKRALELLNKQLEAGAAPIYLLSMIIRQFRILLQVKEATGGRIYFDHQAVAKELGLHPFVVQKSMAQVNKYSFADLEKIYQRLQELDLKLKSTRHSPESLFALLVMA